MRRPYAAMKENTEQLSSEEKQYRKMTEEPVCRLIMKLGLPTTISMLITNVYNMVDTWFVSRLGTSATGAVGIVFGLMAIIQAFGFMFGQGAGTNISRALGHIKGAGTCIFGNRILLGAVCRDSRQCVWYSQFGWFVPVTGKYRDNFTICKNICFYVLLSAPAMATGCVMNNILRYEGYASLAMVGLVSGGVLNMAGDAFFMFGLHMGVRGAALSTMISQYISFGILLYFCCAVRHKAVCPFGILRRKQVSLKYSCVRFSKYGAPGTCKYFYDGIECASGCLWRCGNCCDECCIANFYVYFQCGTRNWSGFQPVSSFNYGARKYTRLRKAFWFTLFLDWLIW